MESSSAQLQPVAADPEAGGEEEGYAPVLFTPRPLRNLLLIDDIASLMPCTGLLAANLLKEETPQLYALCGRGPRSSLRILRQGVAVSEMAVSPLPGQPTAVWTVRRSNADAFDSYIVVAFLNATLARRPPATSRPPPPRTCHSLLYPSLNPEP